ncbi:nucleotide exchange factor GrpE [Paenibacillus sp. y28]|uniref:nucleotide exchange factor GrpE n=1 Tax=Paenibacillus sp. y28 TaxID=3129110 RepID=UPI00301B224E
MSFAKEEQQAAAQTADDATYKADAAGEGVQPEPADTEAEAAGASAEADTAANVQIAALQQQLEESQQRALRAQADFDNFRRRSRQEKEEFAKYASLKLIEQLVPVIDNFDRALLAAKANSDYDALIKGVDMIYRQFDQVLSAEGLVPIDAVGQPFNPEFHQAIMQVQSEEHEEGIVVEEVQKGYMLKDKVIRPAMVKVSS